MSARCRHPRPRVHEERNARGVYEFENGAVVNEHAEDDSPTGAYFVHCPDCGYGRRVKDGGIMPQWIRGLIDVVQGNAW